MTRGYINPAPVNPEMKFSEFLKRSLQTNPIEFDKKIKGTAAVIQRVPRKNKRVKVYRTKKRK